MSDRATLKAFFQTGDFPTDVQFADLIDQTVNIVDDYAQFGKPNTAQLLLSSLQILSLNTTPKRMVAAAGAGTVHLPVLLLLQYTFVTTIYASSVRPQLIYAGATIPVMSAVTPILESPANANCLGIQAFAVPAVNQLPLNTDLNLEAPTTDPTAGDGTLTATLLYHTFTI